MLEAIATILQVFLIIIAFLIVRHKENFTIIIYIATFGLVAATLYAMNQAPDVAIAEVAIGSAIIPLIYVISISRQREYIILDRVDHDRFQLDEENIKVYDILTSFVDKHELRMNVCAGIEGAEETLTDELNVDLIIVYNDDTGKFELKGKASSVLIDKLKTHCAPYDFIDVVPLKEGGRHV
jgi:putative multicomponent Na+:H+ antiporter subunit B